MTVEVPALAAGFASQFDTIGPYVGFGSLIAVIAMAILVFSQGRELQRLREWAGSAPERLDALEQQLQEERTARPPAAGPGRLAPHPGAQVPPTPPVPAGAAPAVGAGAAAGVAGAAVPPAPPLAAGAAAAARVSAGGATPPRPVPPGPANVPGQSTRVVPAVSSTTPRATTAAGRANAARQREPEPPKRSVGQLIGVALVAVVVVAGVLFATGVIGGDTTPPTAQENEDAQREQERERTQPRAKTYSAPQVSVTVLNATGQSGLAKTGSDLLDNKRFATGAVGDYTENGAGVFKDQSIVAYREGRGNRDAARDIAKHLGLRSSVVKQMDDAIRSAVSGTPRIVVVLGQDYANQDGAAPADANQTGTSTTGTQTAPPSGTDGAGGTGDDSITGDVTGDVVADTTVGTP